MSDFSFSDVGITLPTLQDIEEKSIDELKIVAKFRHQETKWGWYIIAGSEIPNNDMLLYGYVVGNYNEFGNIMLSDLLLCGAKFDPKFQPCYLQEVMK